MKWFWCIFFMIWPVLAIAVCLLAPSQGWWFPGESASPLGRRIDSLFYIILWITTVVFIGTQVALGYVLFKGAKRTEPGSQEKAWYSHGRHELEVIWSVVPAIVLLFIALYQMDVWAEFRVKDAFPRKRMEDVLTRLKQVRTSRDTLALAEVSGRQFEWRIRYPGFDANGNLLPLMPDPQPTDLYSVNDLHLPAGAPVMINLKSQDVQHSFFLPELRIKQDAVPGLVIPVWFEADTPRTFQLLCAELCGWGHYKMAANFVADTEENFLKYLKDLQQKQNYDGIPTQPATGVD
ncbi:cytochrome c oxidase subunit II [Planctomicrobium piriforme]|uniref:Cytochrome c oxidase subunit 2 n=1 Tax=Planctomicrobium piriforme TaxID=1576369 RepID=A0A1I3CYM0_9PLAN|nr:cytochrome c oxidase subunit II [Planctomicrobium piriforme]SFH79488.1 cytochrome c oxidase subunit 2 [Planctomicrobium piriforme]